MARELRRGAVWLSDKGRRPAGRLALGARVRYGFSVSYPSDETGRPNVTGRRGGAPRICQEFIRICQEFIEDCAGASGRVVLVFRGAAPARGHRAQRTHQRVGRTLAGGSVAHTSRGRHGLRRSSRPRHHVRTPGGYLDVSARRRLGLGGGTPRARRWQRWSHGIGPASTCAPAGCSLRRYFPGHPSGWCSPPANSASTARGGSRWSTSWCAGVTGTS